jgi:hypothetical protein
MKSVWIDDDRYVLVDRIKSHLISDERAKRLLKSKYLLSDFCFKHDDHYWFVQKFIKAEYNEKK